MDVAPIVTLAAAVVAVLAVVVLVLALRAGRRRVTGELAASRADVEALSARVDDLSRQLTALREPAADEQEPSPTRPEFVITSLPEGAVVPERAPEPAPEQAPLTAGQFASVAAGESVVRLASLAYGVRRALSAESRNRIGFEMRQEVKRSRRARRRDLRDARRRTRTEQAGGERADLRPDAA